MECLTWVLSLCSDLDMENMMHGSNEIDIVLGTVVKLVFCA